MSKNTPQIPKIIRKYPNPIKYLLSQTLPNPNTKQPWHQWFSRLPGVFDLAFSVSSLGTKSVFFFYVGVFGGVSLVRHDGNDSENIFVSDAGTP